PRPAAPRHLPSFPTRRSSDLHPSPRPPLGEWLWRARWAVAARAPSFSEPIDAQDQKGRTDSALSDTPAHGSHERTTERRTPAPRSEEHTSELQSRFDLVCRLL